MTVLPGLLRQGHHQWCELCGWDSAPSQQIWLKHLKFCSLCSEWATPSSGENTCSMLNFFGRITPKRKLISDTEFKKKKWGGGRWEQSRGGGEDFHGTCTWKIQRDLWIQACLHPVSKIVARWFWGSSFFDPSMFSLTLSSFSGFDHFTHPIGKPWQLQSYNFSRRELSFLKTSSKRFEAYTLVGIRLLNQSLGLQVCFNFYFNRLNYKALQEPGVKQPSWMD